MAGPPWAGPAVAALPREAADPPARPLSSAFLQVPPSRMSGRRCGTTWRAAAWPPSRGPCTAASPTSRYGDPAAGLGRCLPLTAASGPAGLWGPEPRPGGLPHPRSSLPVAAARKQAAANHPLLRAVGLVSDGRGWQSSEKHHNANSTQI